MGAVTQECAPPPDWLARAAVSPWKALLTKGILAMGAVTQECAPPSDWLTRAAVSPWKALLTKGILAMVRSHRCPSEDPESFVFQ